MLRDGLVPWSGLVACVTFAAFADVAVFGPGAWVAIPVGLLAVASWWLFAFAAIRAMYRNERGGAATARVPGGEG